MMTPAQKIVPARVEYDAVVAVCRECGNDSKGHRKRLKSEVKRRGLRVRVIASSCLDVCPKQGVTIVLEDRCVVVRGDVSPASILAALQAI